MSQDDETPTSTTRVEPFKNLEKNWTIDIVAALQQFLMENLHTSQQTSSLAHAEALINFAKAAMLIEGTAAVYCRKVEHLYQLCFDLAEFTVTEPHKNTANNSENYRQSSEETDPEDADTDFDMDRAPPANVRRTEQDNTLDDADLRLSSLPSPSEGPVLQVVIPRLLDTPQRPQTSGAVPQNPSPPAGQTVSPSASAENVGLPVSTRTFLAGAELAANDADAPIDAIIAEPERDQTGTAEAIEPCRTRRKRRAEEPGRNGTRRRCRLAEAENSKRSLFGQEGQDADPQAGAVATDAAVNLDGIPAASPNVAVVQEVPEEAIVFNDADIPENYLLAADVPHEDDTPLPQKTYEEFRQEKVTLCRQAMQDGIPGIEQRVRRWEERMRPLLREESSRRSFDCEVYSHELLNMFAAEGQTLSFPQLVAEQPCFEVCRKFFAVLLLANHGNVELIPTLAKQLQQQAFDVLPTPPPSQAFNANAVNDNEFLVQLKSRQLLIEKLGEMTLRPAYNRDLTSNHDQAEPGPSGSKARRELGTSGSRAQPRPVPSGSTAIHREPGLSGCTARPGPGPGGSTMATSSQSSWKRTVQDIDDHDSLYFSRLRKKRRSVPLFLDDSD